MKTRYHIATVLIFLCFFIHIIGGELTDIRSLVNSGLAANIQVELRAVWYLAGVDFLLSGIFMILILRKKKLDENKLLINFIGIRMMLYGILFLIVVSAMNCGILEAPQWILLISIGVLYEWDFLKLSLNRRKKINN